jgi:general secretion pathway protein C
MLLSIVKRYVWVLNLILLIGIAYVLTQIVHDKIRGKVSPPLNMLTDSRNKGSGEIKVTRANARHSRNQYDVILKKNIFGVKNTSISTGINPEEARPTTLHLELLGTVINPGERSLAIIKNTETGKVKGYFEGELIDIIQNENVKLSKIGNCIAIVERNEPEKIKCKKDIIEEETPSEEVASAARIPQRDRLLRLRNARRNSPLSRSTEGIREVSEGVYEVDQKMLDELLGDPNQILTQARVIPQEDGLRFFGIRPNSIFFKIGLRNGDVIHKINDVELDNVENALSLFEELRRQTRFTIDLTRRGQRLTYEYTVR